jgi:hypothetical protein
MNTRSTTAGATSRRKSILSAAAKYVGELCAGAREGREIEARYDMLARKPASELRKLGLTRADVSRAAVTGTKP